MMNATTSPVSLPQRIGHYLSLIKFSHTVFALPFALIGFTLGWRDAAGIWHWDLFIKMLLCMVFARSAAMAFNRWLDRRFDALNPRTAVREIPAGVIRPGNALAFTIICSLGFVLTTWFMNRTVFYLSFIALFVILFYSYTKRITALCHLVLGVGLALAPIGAYLTLSEHFSWLPVIFSCIVFTWVAGFDIIYALQDIDFDRSQQLHSIPAALGLRGALNVSNVLHIITGSLAITAGIYGHFSWIYWIGAAVFISMLIYQHLLVKPTDLSKVNMAFATTNGIASICFAVVTILSIVLSYTGIVS